MVTGDIFFYTYDSRGNMTGDGEKDYVFDGQDRLVQVRDEDGEATVFAYDSRGRRIAVEHDGKVTKYYYLGESDKVVKEVRPDGSEITFTYDNEGYPLTMSYNGQTYYYVFNGHGDVVALTDTKGVKAASYRYAPWGQVLEAEDDEDGYEDIDEKDAEENKEDSADDAAKDDEKDDEISEDDHGIEELNPYRYAGYRYDEKTGLYYLKTRYYNPQLGRFLSRDKYWDEEMAMHPVAQNKYVYVNNTPVNLVDPDGQKGRGSGGGSRGSGGGSRSSGSSSRSSGTRTASTVSSLARTISSSTSFRTVIQSGTRLAANIMVSNSKGTMRDQLNINRQLKTEKKLIAPKMRREKIRSIVNGFSATINSFKKLVSRDISNKDRFVGANKLTLLALARTSKGDMVRYAMPNKEQSGQKLMLKYNNNEKELQKWMKNGNMQASFKDLVTKAGGTISYNVKDRTVTATINNKTIKIKIDNLDSRFENVGGTIRVYVRDFPQMFGLSPKIVSKSEDKVTIIVPEQKYNKLASNGEYGIFYYRDIPNSKGLIEVDPDWVAENIVYYELPKNLQNLKQFKNVKRLKVNKLALPHFKQAFETISKDPQLLKLITTLDPGTFYPRHVRNDFSKGISNHSWGTAIDINASTHDRYVDPKKEPNDPNLILWNKVFRPAGFNWGNRYDDSMHFEIIK